MRGDAARLGAAPLPPPPGVEPGVHATSGGAGSAWLLGGHGARRSQSPRGPVARQRLSPDARLRVPPAGRARPVACGFGYRFRPQSRADVTGGRGAARARLILASRVVEANVTEERTPSDPFALLWTSQPRFLSQASCALCPGLTSGSPCLWTRGPIVLPARVSPSAGDRYRPHLDTDDEAQRF